MLNRFLAALGILVLIAVLLIAGWLLFHIGTDQIRADAANHQGRPLIIQD